MGDRFYKYESKNFWEWIICDSGNFCRVWSTVYRPEEAFPENRFRSEFFLGLRGLFLQVRVEKFFITNYLRLWELFFEFRAQYISPKGLFQKSDIVHNFFLGIGGPFLQVAVKKFFLTKYLRLWDFFFVFTARYIVLKGLFRKSDLVHNFFLSHGGSFRKVQVEKFFLTKYWRLGKFLLHFTARYSGLKGLFRKSDLVFNFFLSLMGPFL